MSETQKPTFQSGITKSIMLTSIFFILIITYGVFGWWWLSVLVYTDVWLLFTISITVILSWFSNPKAQDNYIKKMVAFPVIPQILQYITAIIGSLLVWYFVSSFLATLYIISRVVLSLNYDRMMGRFATIHKLKIPKY